jgi:hypothetical protein
MRGSDDDEEEEEEEEDDVSNVRSAPIFRQSVVILMTFL